MPIPYAKHFAIFCIQVSLVGGVWSLINFTTKTEYVCPSIGDTQVENSQWLDLARACVIILSVIFVTVYQLSKQDHLKDQALMADMQKFTQILAGLGTAILILTLVLTGHVCSSEHCVLTSAIDECTQNKDSCADLEQQVAAMSGVSTAIFPGGISEAINYLSIATNYCTAQLQHNFDQSDTLGTSLAYGEQCLAFSCNNLVSGRVSQKVTLLSALVLAIIGNALLGWVVIPAAMAQPVSQNTKPSADTAETADTAVAKTTAVLPKVPDLRRGAMLTHSGPTLRRRHHAYSAVRQNIAF